MKKLGKSWHFYDELTLLFENWNKLFLMQLKKKKNVLKKLCGAFMDKVQLSQGCRATAKRKSAFNR